MCDSIFDTDTTTARSTPTAECPSEIDWPLTQISVAKAPLPDAWLTDC